MAGKLGWEGPGCTPQCFCALSHPCVCVCVWGGGGGGGWCSICEIMCSYSPVECKKKEGGGGVFLSFFFFCSGSLFSVLFLLGWCVGWTLCEKEREEEKERGGGGGGGSPLFFFFSSASLFSVLSLLGCSVGLFV